MGVIEWQGSAVCVGKKAIREVSVLTPPLVERGNPQSSLQTTLQPLQGRLR